MPQLDVRESHLLIARGSNPGEVARGLLSEAMYGGYHYLQPSNLSRPPSFQPKSPGSLAFGINQSERALISTVELVLQALWGAFRRANQDIEKREARYELPQNPPSIEHLTITAPSIDVSVELRDLAHNRKTTHVTRFRITPAKKSRSVTFTVMDPLIRDINRKLFFSSEDPNLITSLKAFREQMAEALIDRAERAYLNRRQAE